MAFFVLCSTRYINSHIARRRTSEWLKPVFRPVVAITFADAQQHNARLWLQHPLVDSRVNQLIDVRQLLRLRRDRSRGRKFERELGFSDAQIGSLNAIYSLPNIFLVLIGGLLVERFGAARVTLWTTAICLAGAALTAWRGDSAGYTPMIVFFAS